PATASGIRPAAPATPSAPRCPAAPCSATSTTSSPRSPTRPTPSSSTWTTGPSCSRSTTAAATSPLRPVHRGRRPGPLLHRRPGLPARLLALGRGRRPERRHRLRRREPGVRVPARAREAQDHREDGLLRRRRRLLAPRRGRLQPLRLRRARPQERRRRRPALRDSGVPDPPRLRLRSQPSAGREALSNQLRPGAPLLMKITALIAVLLLAASARAIELSLEENRGERGSVGYVDMQRLFNNSPDSQRAKEGFEELVRQAEERVNMRKAELVKLRQELDATRVERDALAHSMSLAPVSSTAAPAASLVPAATPPPPAASTAAATTAPAPAH